MTTIAYFKLQAKNLYRDFKTQKSYFDSTYGRVLFEYTPRFFDVEALITDFDIDESKFSLMNAQHIIAKLVGFKKWSEMLKASPSALELSKLLFENMHKISDEEWQIYISNVENENNVKLEDDFKLDIFKQVFAEVDGHETYLNDYRLFKHKETLNNIIETKELKKEAIMISALPISTADREEFINTANSSFERVFDQIEPQNPEILRSIWNAEKYIDEDILTLDKLPVDRDYALSLVDAYMVGYVIQLAIEADELAINLN